MTNFSDTQERSMVYSISCDCWWHLKIVALECRPRWASAKTKDMVGVETSQGWAVPRLSLRLGRPRWFESQSGLQEYTGTGSGCGRDCVSGETACCHLREKKYLMGPTPSKPQLPLHTDISLNRHLAPIKTTVQHCHTELPSLRERCTGLKLTGP